MSGGSVARGSPLRAEDPARIGEYELVARLGEGGMGRVYLARSPAGALVAVKLIRTDLARTEVFRRRFPGEVARARQVPPFCTAEVLDADPDHDPPYLVVEYVDGPDLATVVRERGPLSPGNLHGLAIGVATALTAIHGAGVIHRDLKASNVLLAPGSPKVIDFGLAREVDTTAHFTSTGELVGTVAYMAPERIEPAGRELTPAADVFAWGVVVAYAGTGRVPFEAESLPAMATRILTRPPELAGLTGALRGLVEQALAKDPADRPTARTLLDRLLAIGPAATMDMSTVVQRPAGRPTRRTVAGLALAAVLAVALVAGGLAAGFPARFGSAANPAGSPPPPSPPPPAMALVPAGALAILSDPLTAPGRWPETEHQPSGSTCALGGVDGLVVTGEIASFRCPGPRDDLADLAVFVDVALLDPDSCATVWFRFTVTDGGYALRVCQEAYYLVTHGIPEPHTVRTLRELPLEPPLAAAGTTRVGVVAEGELLRLYRDGRLVGEWSDGTFARGTVQLGVLQMRPEDRPPYRVSFGDVEIWGSGG
jgi:hypothetical protein